MADTTNMLPAPKRDGFFTRLSKAVRYTITGLDGVWMGPNQPLQPLAPEADVKSRAFDYPVSLNLFYTPRGTEEISFDRLKRLADNCGIVRSVIETRKDQVCALKFNIRPVEMEPGRRNVDAKYEQKIEMLENFMKYPDRRLDWHRWIRSILEQYFVYDAVSIYRRKTRGKMPYSWELIDGSSIKPLIDKFGRTPMPPDPAYQQVLKGLPVVDYATFTTGDLLYYVGNPRVDRLYGYSHVEQIISYIEMQIARVRTQSSYFSEGNIPDGFLEAPESMTADQIERMQQYWDSIFAGNIEQRRRAWWVPSGTKWQEMKQPPLQEAFDEWLARVICYVFSIPPTPFIKQNNRATAESAAETASAEGLQPVMGYIERLINTLIVMDFGIDDVEFAFDIDEEYDPAKRAVQDIAYVRAGIKSIDQVRVSLGDDPWGGSAGEPMYATASGYVAIDPVDPTSMVPGGFGAPMGADGKPAPRPHPPAAGGKPDASEAKPKPAEPAADGKGKPGQGAEPPAEKLAKRRAKALLIRRPVLNSHELLAWAQSRGIAKATGLNDLHVTIAYSRTLVPFERIAKADSSVIWIDGGSRSMQLFDGGALALSFDSPELQMRFHELASDGLSWDYPEYNPHVTLDRAAAAPEGDAYQGPILLGPEEWEVVEEPEPETETVSDIEMLVDVAKVVASEPGHIEAAAAEAHPEPSDAQVQAGNYRHGHVRIHGLDISIENAAGSVRRGVDKNGVPWKSVLPTAYGYIRRAPAMREAAE